MDKEQQAIRSRSGFHYHNVQNRNLNPLLAYKTCVLIRSLC
jgi:hypothetical protein